MILTEEEIENLPRLTEEQVRQIEEDARLYPIERILREFDEVCDIIEEMYDKYKGVLHDDEIRRLIKEEKQRRGLL